MNSTRFDQITSRYADLTIALLGDFCLDRYLEIDPARRKPRWKPACRSTTSSACAPSRAAAGTVLNNLVALGVGRIIPLGFAGDDGEGFELVRALQAMPGVSMDAFVANPLAPHVHLLQAAGGRAGQAAPRTESPGQQELDAHAGGGRRRLAAALRRHAERDRRPDHHGSG